MTEPIVFLNGEFMPQSSAQVSIFDRGFLFADGIYEVIPVIEGQAVDFKPFVARLKYSLQQMSLQWPDNHVSQWVGGAGVNALETQLTSLLDKIIELNSLKEGGVYLQVTRGVAPREFAFPDNVQATLAAFTFDKPIISSPYADNGVAVIVTEDLRWKRRDIKSIALLAQCLAKQTAAEENAFEAWMVEDGYITEGSSSTAYIVKDNKIITRPLSNDVLPGIRRQVLIGLAEQSNLDVEQRLFTVEEAYDADEAFLSSATTLVLPITKIDGQKIGSGKVGSVAKKARQLYIDALYQQLS